MPPLPGDQDPPDIPARLSVGSAQEARLGAGETQERHLGRAELSSDFPSLFGGGQPPATQLGLEESQKRHLEIVRLLKGIALSQERLEAAIGSCASLEPTRSSWQHGCQGTPTLFSPRGDVRYWPRDERDRSSPRDERDRWPSGVVNRHTTGNIQPGGSRLTAATAASRLSESPGAWRSSRTAIELRSVDEANLVRLQKSATPGSTLKPGVLGPVSSDADRRTCRAMHPDSKANSFIDMFTLVVLFVDSILIPYQIAWKVQGTPTMRAINSATLAFWTVDLLWGFNIAYYSKGEVISDRRTITVRYMKTLFVPNLLAVVADFSAVIVMLYYGNADSSWVGLLPRILKLQRVVHVLATLRRWVIQDKFERLFWSFGLDRHFRASSLGLQLVILLMWLNHMCACAWYILGASRIREWAESSGIPVDTNSLQEYMYAYLWATMAIISGSVLVTPETPSQTAFAILIIQFGLMFCSIIVGILTDTLLDFRMTNKGWMEQRRKMLAYMAQSSVPSSFVLSVTEEVLEAQGRDKRIQEDEVKHLQLLSQRSRDKLRGFVFGHLVGSETFIRSCSLLCSTLVGDICANCLTHTVLHPGKDVFEVNTEAEGPYLVMWGTFEYIANDRPPSFHDDKRDSYTFSDGSRRPTYRSHQSVESGESVLADLSGPRYVEEFKWICQLALFCTLKHAGSMMACTYGEVMTIHGDKFRRVVHNKPKLNEIAEQYGKAIMDAVSRQSSNAPAQPLCDINPSIEHVQVLSLMPGRTRYKLSQAALSVMDTQAARFFHAHKDKSHLMEEVKSGECDLVVASEFRRWNEPPKETVLRVVSVVVLRLARQDGKLLVQIGRLQDGAPKPGMKLPGTKVKSGEVAADTLERFLNHEFPNSFADGVVMEKHNVDQEVKDSSSFNVKTQYFRHVFHADFTAALEESLETTRMRPRRSGQLGAEDHAALGHGGVGARMSTQGGRYAHGFLSSTSKISEEEVRQGEFDAGFDAGFCEGGDAFLARPGEKSPAIFAWMSPQDIDDPRCRRAAEAIVASRVPTLEVLESKERA